MDGREYLTKLISDRLTMAQQRTSQQRAAIVNRSEIRGVALGLLAASALTQDDMQRILTDLDRTLQSMGIYEEIRFETSSTEHHIAPTYFAKTAEGSSTSQQPAMPDTHTVPSLIRVHPLDGATAVVYGQNATLLSADIWSTSLRIRLAFPHLGASNTDIHRLHHRWRAWDDEGTQYRERGSESSDAQGFLTQSRVFEPAPSPSARQLTVAAPHRSGEDRFTLALQ
ncbi:hypothetical protein [Phytohabitans kaempferiae]|uniref:Uncharacterized protein n=1 Tax=Phytohabitans kaempferiae TaxID=1620943 RepID=A0ABV6MC06_9ACTN